MRCWGKGFGPRFFPVVWCSCRVVSCRGARGGGVCSSGGGVLSILSLFSRLVWSFVRLLLVCCSFVFAINCLGLLNRRTAVALCVAGLLCRLSVLVFYFCFVFSENKKRAEGMKEEEFVFRRREKTKTLEHSTLLTFSFARFIILFSHHTSYLVVVFFFLLFLLKTEGGTSQIHYRTSKPSTTVCSINTNIITVI